MDCRDAEFLAGPSRSAYELEAYGRAKARIFENQRDTDWAVVNAEDAAALELARGGRATRKYFARHQAIDRGVVVEDGWIVERRATGTESWCRSTRCTCSGRIWSTT